MTVVDGRIFLKKYLRLQKNILFLLRFYNDEIIISVKIPFLWG